MSVEAIAREWCGIEDATGRRCKFGPGHVCKCQFTPHRPTEGQYEVLARGERGDVVRQDIGLSEVATIKGLYRRGFLRMRYIGSRTWSYRLTPAGRRLLMDRPR